jgi:hypothetical protein
MHAEVRSCLTMHETCIEESLVLFDNGWLMGGTIRRI